MGSTLVMKFGGAALETPAHFQQVAKQVRERRKAFDRLAVVVSAMGRMTDELMALAHEVSPSPLKREQDMLISVGERISMALLAMALADLGVNAISLTGSQSGIITCERHLEARILRVKPHRLLHHLDEGKVAIVAGFQGVSEEKEITTLGRGGSDTSAVALGVALGAEVVEFYKDVRGLYSADPKKNGQAIVYPQLSYEKALELTHDGRSPLHPRSILLASKNNIPLHVLSFKEEERQCFSGTIIKSDQLRPHTGAVYEDDERKSSDLSAGSFSSDRKNSFQGAIREE